VSGYYIYLAEYLNLHLLFLFGNSLYIGKVSKPIPFFHFSLNFIYTNTV